MEVTRKNFRECLPLISESIEKADFLVIDTEFTGLINGRDVSIFDSPQEYYTTLLNGSTEFLLIQYGLCAFYWNHEENHYMNDAYNFYLFPRGRPGPAKIFLCQSSSLDFLASQGFDFNKLIKEGISYMTEPIETRLRESLTERQKLHFNDKDFITIPEENKQHIEEICKKVRTFLDEKKTDEMEIDRCNAFIRRLLFQELGVRFKNEAFIETKVMENKSRVLKITRLHSETEGKNKDMLKREKEWEELEDAVGFSKVARMISQSEKLVIGHNMLLDLIHTLNHCFQPLPTSYTSFKEFAHAMFPRILDTKYMSSLPPFKDKVNSSVLLHLLATLSVPPFSLPKAESIEGRGYRRADDKPHEAGFDAYVTGLCFLAMHQHLAKMRGDEPSRLTDPDCAALKPFLNKLFLAKTAHQESPYMNLNGADPSPSRDHVFHLTFPKEWQRIDINQLFSAFGPITVQFIDETTALVALTRRDQARTVARTFANNARISLVPYAKYKLLSAKSPQPVERMLAVQQMTTVNTPDLSRVRQGSVSKPADSSDRSRARSNSASAATQAPPRKRTSSGAFQVDETEPPPKKPELTRPNSDQAHKRPEVISNGRRKAACDSKDHKDTKDRKDNKDRKDTKDRKDNKDCKDTKDNKDCKDGKDSKEKPIERFDSEATTNCVSVFKESDNWD